MAGQKPDTLSIRLNTIALHVNLYLHIPKKNVAPVPYTYAFLQHHMLSFIHIYIKMGNLKHLFIYNYNCIQVLCENL